MDTNILLDILFELLSKRKVTAKHLAEKYNVSERTIYRYVEALSQKVPLFIKRGRNGGICLSDSYRLPVGFMSTDEYASILDGLQIAYSHDPNPRFLNARRKLNSQVKTEQRNLALIGDAKEFFIEEALPSLQQKMQVVQDCIREERLADIEYTPRGEEKISTKIEPHALILKQGVWHLYAFCHLRRTFHLFTLGRISAIVKTEDSFRPRSFAWQDIPLPLEGTKALSVRVEISEEALNRTIDKVGVESLRFLNEKWIAELSLPEENAEQQLLSLGAGVKVLSPDTLRKKVARLANSILKNNL